MQYQFRAAGLSPPIIWADGQRARLDNRSKTMTITLYVNQDELPSRVVRYSDGGDALEWFHDVPLRRAIQIAAELIELHAKCDVELALCNSGHVVQTFTDASR
jgi:hypothetical protein